MAIRFGTYTEFQCPPGRDHADLINDMLRVAEHTDRTGFDVFTTLEHPFHSKFALNVAPLVLFAILAERTSNLRFRTLCHVLPLHNPMVLAGEIAEADILLKGRLEVGIGRGHAWLQEKANIPYEESLGRFHECIDIMIKAWTEERFSYRGKYYTCEDLSVVPRPLQRPHPAIFQVGTSSKTFVQAGQRGWRVVIGGPVDDAIFVEPHRTYLNACAAAGTTPYVGFGKAIFLAEDDQTAVREAETYASKFIEYNVSPLKEMDRSEAVKERMRKGGFDFYAGDDFFKMASVSYRDIVERGIMYIGSPERIARQLLTLHDLIPYDEFIIISHYGGIPAEKAMRTQELFHRHVMPAVRRGIADKRARQGMAARP
ncbi:MAG: LLM class flavin-dependent oxidoreductase [Alphaproteobacteria bacterium]|nr:LLM class flavin-dependent oxidoreductase [Alphaproteobacteria bacterium]